VRPVAALPILAIGRSANTSNPINAMATGMLDESTKGVFIISVTPFHEDGRLEVYKLDLSANKRDLTLTVRSERIEERPDLGLTLREIDKHLAQRDGQVSHMVILEAMNHLAQRPLKQSHRTDTIQKQRMTRTSLTQGWST